MINYFFNLSYPITPLYFLSWVWAELKLTYQVWWRNSNFTLILIHSTWSISSSHLLLPLAHAICLSWYPWNFLEAKLEYRFSIFFLNFNFFYYRFQFFCIDLPFVSSFHGSHGFHFRFLNSPSIHLFKTISILLNSFLFCIKFNSFFFVEFLFFFNWFLIRFFIKVPIVVSFLLIDSSYFPLMVLCYENLLQNIINYMGNYVI